MGMDTRALRGHLMFLGSKHAIPTEEQAVQLISDDFNQKFYMLMYP